MPRASLPTDAAALERALAGVGRSRQEVSAVALLDPQWQLLSWRHVAGGRASVAVPLRRLVADAVLWRASQMVLAHNHPAGDAHPSGDDLAYTRVLGRTLAAVGVTLHDHLIFAGGTVFRFRDAGLL